MIGTDDGPFSSQRERGFGTPAAHGVREVLLGQKVGPHRSYPHNLKVVGSNPTPATKSAPPAQ
jgi:hypothetical protein